MMIPRFLLLAVALTACSPADVADKVGRRAAESVVQPVVGRNLIGGQAAAATRCIVDNASAGDVEALARDYGVEAGTSTVNTVRRIAFQPETLACLTQAGLPALRL
jgi:hypothetical protein